MKIILRKNNGEVLSVNEGKDTVFMFRLAIYTLFDLVPGQNLELVDGERIIATWNHSNLSGFFEPETTEFFKRAL